MPQTALSIQVQGNEVVDFRRHNECPFTNIRKAITKKRLKTSVGEDAEKS